MKRVISCIDKEEWTAVYKEVYSNDANLLQHGLNRIAVWKSRLLHRLSTAIELTWELGSVWLADKYMTNKDSKAMSLQYAMCLVRFVNLLTEKSQMKMYAQPVHQLAEQLGLPEWLVDLRHDATHTALPQLPLLKSGAKFAWQWLKENYWEAQADDETFSVVAETNLADILSTYVQAQFSFMQGERGETKRNIRHCLDTIEKALENQKNEDRLVELLLKDSGHLVPTVEQMEALSFNINGFQNAKGLELPQKLLDLWLPLLQLLHKKSLISALLLYTLSNVHSTSLTWECHMRLCWANEFIRLLRSSSKSYLMHQDVLAMVNLCMQKPSDLMFQLLPQIMNLSKFPESQRDKLIQLMMVWLNREEINTYDTVHKIYTLDDIEMAMEPEVEEQANTSSLFSSSLWPMPRGISYRYLPLGSCPDITIDYTTLELPNEVDCLQTFCLSNYTEKSAFKDGFTESSKSLEHNVLLSSDVNSNLPSVDSLSNKIRNANTSNNEIIFSSNVILF